MAATWTLDWRLTGRGHGDGLVVGGVPEGEVLDHVEVPPSAGEASHEIGVRARRPRHRRRQEHRPRQQWGRRACEPPRESSPNSGLGGHSSWKGGGGGVELKTDAHGEVWFRAPGV